MCFKSIVQLLKCRKYVQWKKEAIFPEYKTLDKGVNWKKTFLNTKPEKLAKMIFDDKRLWLFENWWS